MDLTLFNNDVLTVIKTNLLYGTDTTVLEKMNLALVCNEFLNNYRTANYTKIKQLCKRYYTNGSFGPDWRFIRSQMDEITIMNSFLPKDTKSVKYLETVFKMKYNYAFDSLFPIFIILEYQDNFFFKICGGALAPTDPTYDERFVKYLTDIISCYKGKVIIPRSEYPTTKKGFIDLCSKLTTEHKLYLFR